MTPLQTRVPEDVLQEFDARAAELGKSRAEHLRELVLDYLMSADEEPESKELVEVRRELRGLRASLMTSVSGLLTNLGNFEPDEADEWVRHHLRK